MDKYGALSCPSCGGFNMKESKVAFQPSDIVRDSSEITELSKTAEVTSEVYTYKCKDCGHEHTVVR